MLVTINTDASFNLKYKIGAFAFWIVCDAGKIMHSGALKGHIQNSTEAEFKCIANALKALLNSPFERIHKVIINTDFESFHGYLKNKNKKRDNTSSVFSKILSALVIKHDLKKGWLEVRHVKSHADIDEKRKWVNDWCDKQAKLWIGHIINEKSAVDAAPSNKVTK